MENETIVKDGETAIDLIIAETDRLFIREFNIDDADAKFEYSGDAENTYFMDWGPETREGAENFIHSRLAHQITENRLVCMTLRYA